MKRRAFLASSAGLAILPALAGAQPERVVRLGFVTAQQPASLASYLPALRAGLAEAGYVEGRNLALEFRYGNDASERVPELVAELVRSPVDVLIAQGTAVAVVARLGLPVPVVYVFSGDPVTAGFAESLARPRGNMTGLTFLAAEMNGKRLELLRDIDPAARQVAIVANPEHPGSHLERSYTEQAGKGLGMTTRFFATATGDELARAFAAMTKAPPQAILLFADGFAIQNRQAIIDFGMSHRAPVVSGWPVFAQAGALCTYGPRLASSYRRVGYYVDRIVKGARPADLPIEQPTEFELVVNLRTARALGLSVPPSLLLRADEVIR